MQYDNFNSFFILRMSYLKKGMNEPLTEKELMEIIETFGDSEDELENYSSDDDIEVEHGVSGYDVMKIDLWSLLILQTQIQSHKIVIFLHQHAPI